MTTKTTTFALLGMLGLGAAAIASAQMSTPGNFRVSETGAAVYEIPIKVPPGVAGMEPKLSLVYNSQSGNGLLGVGWSLQGLSAISRCPRTMAQDGVRGGVNYDSNDRFCLDGQRLMAVSGTYGADGTEYRTERESFTKVTSHGTAGNGPSYFIAKTKSGQTIEYGNTVDSKIPAVGTSTLRLWAVSRISDTKTNYVSFTYSGYDDSANPQYQPTRIDYGGNTSSGAPASASVRFYYEVRPDWLLRYTAGVRTNATNRLKGIQIFSDTTNQIREYKLTYNTGSATQRSRLGGVAECDGSGANCLPAHNVTWRDGSTAFSPAMSPQNGTDWASWPSAKPFSGDFNGDGLTDLAISANGMGGIGVYLANGNGTFQPVWSSQTGVDWVSWPSARPISGDFNGDGLTDVAISADNLGGLGVYLSNGNGTFGAVFSAQAGADWTSWPSARPFSGDFNGDGLTDIAISAYSMGGIGVYLANGNGTFQPVWSPQSGVDWVSWPSARQITGDFNGDGLTDVAISADNLGGLGVYLSNGDGTFRAVFSAQAGADWTSWPSARPFSGDFNGDGLTDIAISANGMGGIGIYLAKGDGTFQPVWSPQTGVDWISWPSARTTVGDFNGDGWQDIAVNAYGLGGIGFYLSNGNGSFRAAWSSQTGTDWGSWPVIRPMGGDFNGDGLSDIAITGDNMGGIGSYSVSMAYPDLVSRLENGVGAATDVSYTSVPNGSFYVKDTGANAAVFPKVDIKAAITYLVASTSENNGAGSTVPTQYRYGGLKAELGSGRGLLGFRWMESVSATGVKQETIFRQDWPYVGMPLQSKRIAPDGTTILSQSDATYACTNPATGAACTIAAGNRYFPHVTQSDETSRDLNNTFISKVRTQNSYDSLGNATQIGVTHLDAGGAATGYSKTTTNTYTNDTTNWLLGRLLRSEVQSTVP